MERGHWLYPAPNFLDEFWLEGPWSEDRAEQQRLNRLARSCPHAMLDRNGTNGSKRRFKCCACQTIWSGPHDDPGDTDEILEDIGEWLGD